MMLGRAPDFDDVSLFRDGENPPLLSKAADTSDDAEVDDFTRHVEIRTIARQEFLAVGTGRKLARLTHARSRAAKGYEPGDVVFYWQQ
eukprot:2264893-Alexandrium_andersonii.AAC.1